MSVVYLVYYRPREMELDQDSRCTGVWTTFTMALESARQLPSHPDDEWCIRQIQLNTATDAETVWDSYTDEDRRTESVYERFFPAGYPLKKGANNARS